MSNDLAEIKKRLIEEDRIVDLFEEIGCDHIKYEQGGSLITAQLPTRFDSPNKRAVQCRVNESLWCYIRNRSDFEGDIFNLVSYLKYDIDHNELQSNLNKSKEFICIRFGWTDLLKGNGKRRIDLLAGIKSMRTFKGNQHVRMNKVRPESSLNSYLDFPIYSWILEGINAETQNEYGIRYDIDTKRIVIPIRNKFGQLVGAKGRLLLDDDVTDTDQKYMYLLKCNQSSELFNFYIASNEIRNKKEVIIVEGEKSCMKFYQHGIYNVVALGSSDMSVAQKQMLYATGIDTKFVLAYDSDKAIDEIQAVAEQLEYRNVQFIYDRDNLLDDKSAPIDSGIETWYNLYENYKYDF